MKAISSAKIREGGMIEVDNQNLIKALQPLSERIIFIFIFALLGTDIWQKICSMKPS